MFFQNFKFHSNIFKKIKTRVRTRDLKMCQDVKMCKGLSVPADSCYFMLSQPKLKLNTPPKLNFNQNQPQSNI